MAVDPRKHSRVLLEGPDRAAARAMMKAVGFNDADGVPGAGARLVEYLPALIADLRGQGYALVPLRDLL